VRFDAIPHDSWLAQVVGATLRVGGASGCLLSREPLGDERFLVTAAHVVGDKTRVHVHWPEGSARCQVNHVDRDHDVALIDIRDIPRELKALGTMWDDEVIAVGHEVWSAGFPDGWPGRHAVLSRGHLAGVDDAIWVAVDAGFGSSGGPVVALRGDGMLIGMVKGRAGNPEQGLRNFRAVMQQAFREAEEALRAAEKRGDPDSESTWHGAQIMALGPLRAMEAIERHFRTGFVEVIPLDRIERLLPHD
jgi:S1-C subfamily serine protease